MALFLSKLFLGHGSKISTQGSYAPLSRPALLPSPAIVNPLDTYILMMASLPNGRGLAGRDTTGGRKHHPAELTEDRWGRKLENLFRRIGNGIRNLFPILPSPDFSGSPWRWTRRKESTFKHPAHSFALHGNRNSLSRRFLEIIRANLPSDGGVVVEVGSGDGGLAQMLRESFGVPVLETDLFHSARGSPSRLRADMALLPFQTNSIPVVVSSFAAEYVGKPALQEIHRILKSGGMFVALVHHKQGIAHKTLLDRLTIDGYIWAVRRPWIKVFLPNFLLESWEMVARTAKATTEVGFLNQQEVADLLRSTGFHPPHIENAPWWSRRSAGWIVVAKKR